MRFRRDLGLTLVEMLIAGFVLSLLLYLAGGISVQAARTGAAAEETAQREQTRELAVETIRHHLSLAGYRGVDTLAPGLGGNPLAFEMSADPTSGDAFTVRYLEERWYALPKVRTLRLSTGRDGRGKWNLYLQEEGAVRQPAVEGVRAFRVSGFLTETGMRLGREAELPLEAAAAELVVRFDWDESAQLLVRFPVPRRVVAEGEP